MTFNRIVTSKVIHCNGGRAIAASGFAAAADGSFTLAKNLSAKTLVFSVPIESGRKIKSFKVLGAVGAGTGKATTVDADLRKVLNGAGAVTDASVGAITQVSKEADYSLADSKLGLTEVVQDGYQYYVLITASTADDNACDVAITGVDVTYN